MDWIPDEESLIDYTEPTALRYHNEASERDHIEFRIIWSLFQNLLKCLICSFSLVSLSLKSPVTVNVIKLGLKDIMVEKSSCCKKM